MKISVVIPTYNRINQLKIAVESVLKQSYPDYEVIVVDDGSTDETHEYLSSIKKDNFIYIKQTHKGPASARNSGIKNAKGEYIAFTDDDCIIPYDWLDKIKNAIVNTQADVIGGFVQNTAKSLFSALSQYITNFFVAFLYKNYKNSSFFTSNNIAYRATSIKKVGCFDERFFIAGGEERLLNYKIIFNGGKVFLSENIFIKHHHHQNFQKFLKQFFNYGRGSFLLFKISHRELDKPMPGIPFNARIAFITESLKSNFLFGWTAIVFFLISQVSALAGFLVQALLYSIQKKKFWGNEN